MTIITIPPLLSWKITSPVPISIATVTLRIFDTSVNIELQDEVSKSKESQEKL